jgi:hypothetical protein
LVGLVRTGQNLAILTVERATTSEDWQAAERQYQRYEAINREVDAVDKALIWANHAELLIRQGSFAETHTLLDPVEVNRVEDDFTRIILTLNRATLALWEQQADVCQQHLLYARQLIDESGGRAEQLAWHQLMLENHILFSTPYDRVWGSQLKQLAASDKERPLDAAKWFLVCGLLLSNQKNYDQSLTLLKRSHKLWIKVGYRYSAALATTWQAQIEIVAGKIADAKQSASAAEMILLPFGETPALQRVHKLQQTIS